MLDGLLLNELTRGVETHSAVRAAKFVPFVWSVPVCVPVNAPPWHSITSATLSPQNPCDTVHHHDPLAVLKLGGGAAWRGWGLN